MMWLMYKIDPSGAFTELGCILIDLCCIIFICMWLIATYIDKSNKERSKKAMVHKKHIGKIIYENSAGAVIHVYADEMLYVYEKINGRLIQCFEVPTLDEGVKYLKSIIESEE